MPWVTHWDTVGWLRPVWVIGLDSSSIATIVPRRTPGPRSPLLLFNKTLNPLQIAHRLKLIHGLKLHMDLSQQPLNILTMVFGFGWTSHNLSIFFLDLVENDFVYCVNRHLSLVDSIFHRVHFKLGLSFVHFSLFSFHKPSLIRFIHTGLSPLGDFLLLFLE